MSLESNKFEQPNAQNNTPENPIVTSDNMVQSLLKTPHEEREKLLKKLRDFLKHDTRISSSDRKRALTLLINLEEAEVVDENGSLLLNLKDKFVSEHVDPNQIHEMLEESGELRRPENNQG